jgi:aldehyde:ferredoxin oxidoreductase
MEYPLGYAGSILRVNLTDGRIYKQELPVNLANRFIAGRGLSARFLYDELKPGIDPLGPANKVIIGTGFCAGTLVPGTQRFNVSAKSPLTGLLGDSNSGGDLGAALK